MTTESARSSAPELTLLLCGDVMSGRGIDQILPHPGAARLFEEHAHSALEYVELAQQRSGSIRRPVDFRYIWGEALAELERRKPDARIVNLETAVTTSDAADPGKGVHYRMHPANVGCLLSARIDCCVLANNHVLDWGERGLRETLAALAAAGIKTAGAGADDQAALAPARIDSSAGRVLVYALACADSGVPANWAAGAQHAGVALLPDLSEQTLAHIAQRISLEKRPGDVTVVSIHWGGNWGYEVPTTHRHFAQRLIEAATVDVVHGHSSHHAKGVEIHRERLILYGCGDLINDYEGISLQDPWRSDLALLYFARLERATGRLRQLTMAPFRRRRMRLERASDVDARFLLTMLNREGRVLGSRSERASDGPIVCGAL